MLRICKVHGALANGDMPTTSEQDFLDQCDESRHRCVFKLNNKRDAELIGCWYQEELQEITKKLFLIEVIRKRRTSQVEKEVLVTLKGWPV